VRLRPTPAGVLAVLALFVASTGTAVAATGGSFLLGRANTETTTASLSNPNGTALSLGGGKGAPAFAVNNSAKIYRLNADALDGLDSTLFQRRIGGTCAPGYSIRTINANGSVVCDDQQASVVEVNAVATGAGVAFCPASYVATGGGYLPDPNAGTVPYASIATVGTDPSTTPNRDFYAATMRNLDGTPFAGQVIITVRCVYGGVEVQTASPSDTPTATLLRQKTAAVRR
jgi:hypothetical protein